MKYTINAVDRAGTPWVICETDFADTARLILSGLRSLGDGRVYWPDYTDDPERGDCETDIEGDEMGAPLGVIGWRRHVGRMKEKED